jgi:hypothetical protein
MWRRSRRPAGDSEEPWLGRDPVLDDRSAAPTFSARPRAGKRGELMELKNSHYDADLETLTDPPREPDLDRLRFLRWLGEHGRLEHAPMGSPAGDYALQATLADVLRRCHGSR